MSDSAINMITLMMNKINNFQLNLDTLEKREMDKINNAQLNLDTLGKRAKALSAKASYLEERIENAELSGKTKMMSPKAKEWLGQVRSVLNEVRQLETKLAVSDEFLLSMLDGGIMPQLMERIDMLDDQSPHLGELVIDVCETRGVEFLATKMVGKAFEENFVSILRLLEGREVSSIGIYGMAGVGKKALAKCINNRLLQKQSQSPVCVFWITVSREFTIASLQEKIAQLIGVKLLDDDGADIKAAKLDRALSQKKNLVLILDDVWEYIDLLKVGCHVSAKCCRLIVTTRSLEVCRQIPCQKVITVEKLREYEAWKLFTETLILGVELRPRVEETAKSMARFCDGLPLGIITLAVSMRGKTLFHSWRATLAELDKFVANQDHIMEQVFETIRWSFNMLNKKDGKLNSIQRCFLHCSSYPQGDVLDRDELVERFISEGLLDGRKSRSTQVDQGHSILDKLVNVCLLETSVSPPGLKMHGLVRGMALNIVFNEIHHQQDH